MNKEAEKNQLRQAMALAEQRLPARYREAADRRMTDLLTAMPEYQSAGTVFCFVGAPPEIDTTHLLADVLQQGKRLCVPAPSTSSPGGLRLAACPEDLHPGPGGIPSQPVPGAELSPDEVDFAILPCLTCSRDGRRLGWGSGFYDRFLAQYRSAAVLLCRERMIRAEIPVDLHDLPVHWVLTEGGLYEDGVPAGLA